MLYRLVEPEEPRSQAGVDSAHDLKAKASASLRPAGFETKSGDNHDASPSPARGSLTVAAFAH